MIAARVATGVLTALVGCGEAYDDLDPDVVNELSRTPGNAIGFDRSGQFQARFEQVDSTDCEEIDLELGQPVCSSTQFGSGMAGISVLQTDGVLQIRLSDFSLTGPIDADRRFAVGGVFDISTGATQGHSVLRIDGMFDEDHIPEAFSARLRHRLRGLLASETTIVEVDMFEVLDVRALEQPQ